MLAVCIFAWISGTLAAEVGAGAPIVRASRAGAALDSDLMKGGGTDDTIVLQGVLDRAANGTPVHLLVDGVALIGGLNVYGNTTIECVNGGGLYLKDGSSRAIIRNVHRSRNAIADEHVAVRGCFLNGNRDEQPGAKPEMAFGNNREADETFISGLQFLGVNDLTIQDVTLWSVRAFGALIGNANRIDIRNVTVDHGAAPDVDLHYANTDGLHFTGPLQYLTVDGVKLRTGDDGLAFLANPSNAGDVHDFGPYVGQGPITDVTVNNVHLMDAVSAMRFTSSTERIDRVMISNVTGTIKGYYLATISHWIARKGQGDFGAITISNVNVNRSLPDARIATEWAARVREFQGPMAAEFNGGEFPFVSVNAHIERLSLINFVTKVADDRPILRIGSSAQVQTLTAELRLHDPELRGVPLELDEGGRIERLNLSVDWKGDTVDQGKNPIASLGGSIGQLHWIDTPPMYVDAGLRGANTVAVTFNQDVKAIDFKAGVKIKVNGKRMDVSRAVRQPDRADVVRYALGTSIHANDRITWAYDATQGFIQNLDGDSLQSVSEKNLTAGTVAKSAVH